MGTRYHEQFAEAMEMPAKDMRHFADALAYVSNIRSQRRFKVLIEESIKATWLKSAPSTTVDVVLHTQDEIHVIDWKTGKIRVEVRDNEQLMYYAVSFAPLAPRAKGVWIHIVQPWADNMEAVFVTTDELRVFMEQAQQAEAEILAGSVKFGPSDHCTFCPANPHSRGDKGKPLCPTMMKLLYPPFIDEDEILGI